ncbi:hypothetical protein BGAL_0287g00030 [Botrytis galanthina]|uniref:F-box domain-containing protein n=1 Tax=Botrytis galanthina TaxID=278940 RepID=A0A4S8QW47_9HELO|nr:hypothetical protein BGAL_0287g00030 [Botrytis galanthina]
MDKIPAEIFRLIIKGVMNTSDLKNLRLVSKSLSILVTEKLFSHCSVNLQNLNEGYDDEESKEVAEIDTANPFTNLEKIIRVPRLMQAVRSVRYITSLEPYANSYLNSYAEKHPPQHFNISMKRIIEKCNRFPNLTTVAVEFAEFCTYLGEEDERGFYLTPAEDSHEYRTAVLKELFRSLNDPRYPTPSLTTLSLKNLQNVNDVSLTGSKDFLAVLKRITDLRMRIVVEYEKATPESSWSLPPMHDFFTELPSTWLAPCADNLTSLTIHCIHWWGYFPKCDWRDVHFPKLKKLELGNYTFSHDWQLDWILSHGETLEVLKLDDCPILAGIRHLGDLDHENYAMTPMDNGGDSEPTVWHYKTKWSDYFQKMQNNLPKLRLLQVGSGVWEMGENFDGGEMRLAEEPSKAVRGTYNRFDPPTAYPYKYFKRNRFSTPWVNKRHFPENNPDEKPVGGFYDIDKRSQPERDQCGYDERQKTAFMESALGRRR